MKRKWWWVDSMWITHQPSIHLSSSRCTRYIVTSISLKLSCESVRERVCERDRERLSVWHIVNIIQCLSTRHLSVLTGLSWLITGPDRANEGKTEDVTCLASHWKFSLITRWLTSVQSHRQGLCADNDYANSNIRQTSKQQPTDTAQGALVKKHERFANI